MTVPIAHAPIATANSNSSSTVPRDTTGAKSLFVVAGSQTNGSIVPPVTDSGGNQWVQVRSDSFNLRLTLWQAVPPVITGPNHVFTVSHPTATYPGICMIAWPDAVVLDKSSGTAGGGNVSQPGIVTPGSPGELVLTAMTANGTGVLGVPPGFTVTDSTAQGNGFFAIALAYQVQTAATPVNPAWTNTVSEQASVMVAAFTPSGVQPPPPPPPPPPATGTTFTVTPSAAFTGTLTLDSGSGQWTPPSLTWSGTMQPQTTTWTSTAAPPATGNVIAVSDPSLFWSPYNWFVSSGAYAQTNNPGAYLKTLFSGTSCTLLLDLTPNTPESVANYPSIAWSIDGGEWQELLTMPGDSSIVLASGLPAGTHSLWLVVSSTSPADDRWLALISVVRITGLLLDQGAVTGATALQPRRMIVFADSNGEGAEIHGSGSTSDATLAFPLILGAALGCEVGVVAFSGQGYVTPGAGNVPALWASWPWLFTAVRRLPFVPDVIVCTHGENDHGNLTAAAVTAQIQAWRAAAPNALIYCCSPANLANASIIQAGVNIASDPKAFYVGIPVNLIGSVINGLWGNSVHMTELGQAYYAAMLAYGIV